ncbi:MAG: V-type ATP synthase subunit E [Lachnospiraceae bacterium]|nr:V-type ATP synthase subunit E [Lachnospiraceae bacterium]
MTGLEKIVDQILAEANTEAQKIVADAETEAKTIRSDAEAQAERSKQTIRSRAEKEAVNLEQRMHSANDLYQRTQTLASKQAIIAEVIDRAYDRVCGMDAATYFGMLEKWIEKYALAQSGEIYFSDADLRAMPNGFEDKIQAAAQAAGGTLKLSRKGKDIKNGFILVYGGVEENCTVSAIFDANREQMQDTVHALLYGKEA